MLGPLGLTIRLKRIADRMTQDARRTYRDLGLEIEPNWHAVLLLVEQEPGLGVADIARRLGLAHPSVSALVGQIAKRGFLRVVNDPQDGRRRTVKLTPKAKRRLPAMKVVWEAASRAIEDMLKDTDGDLLSTLEGFEQAIEARTFERRMQAKLDA